MSKTKGGGSTRNGRDSNAQRLGVKVFGSTTVSAGSIIVRQRGTHLKAGPGVGEGRDHSLFALVDGQVVYQRLGKDRRRVCVTPAEAAR